MASAIAETWRACRDTARAFFPGFMVMRNSSLSRVVVKLFYRRCRHRLFIACTTSPVYKVELQLKACVLHDAIIYEAS